MAKQKISVAGIIFVVGLMVLIVSVSAGFFKNFSVQNNGLTVNVSPSPVASVAQGGSITFGYNIDGGSQGEYTIYGYIDGNQVQQGGYQLYPPNGDISIRFPDAGTHTFHLEAMDMTTQESGQSSDVTVQVIAVNPTPAPTNSATPTATPYNGGFNPTPTATPTFLGGSGGGILQQILNWFSQIWNSIQSFLKSFGL